MPALASQHQDVLRAVKRVVDSGSYILGTEGKQLEKEISAFTGMKWAISVANGTDALILALLYLRHMHPTLRGEGLVATVANSAPATVAAIRRAGFAPVFIDVLPSGLMDPKDLKKKLHGKIMAVVPVHLYGQIADMKAIDELCQRYETAIIEDAAQSLGSADKFKSPRVLAKCVSFYPTKNLGALGDGGMVLTDIDYVNTIIRSLRNYGMDEFGRVVIQNGFNSRLDEIQAAILREKLNNLNQVNYQRSMLAAHYCGSLVNKVQHREYDITQNYHLFTIRHPYRAQIIQALKHEGIETKIHYPYPAHKYPADESYVYLPKTVRHCETVLSLPLWPGMTTMEVEKVSEIVNRVVENA